MAETDKIIITKEGLKKLQDELTYLETEKTIEITAKIKFAREQGDLSENAEYDAAKEEETQNAARIDEIKKILKNVDVVDESDINTDKVSAGNTVKIQNLANGKEETFKIVGATEADFFHHLISNESPLGKELIGKTVNEIVIVNAPIGEIKYKVVEITR